MRAEGARGSIVHLFSAWTGLERAAVRLTVQGAAAVLLTPRFEPRRLPWWGRRFQRIVLPSQRLARAWGEYVPLGRIVVVEPAAVPDPRLGPVYEAGEADADDPERILAAAAAGLEVRSSVAHDLLPPGPGDVGAAWAKRGRSVEDERAALGVVYTEVWSMAHPRLRARPVS